MYLDSLTIKGTIEIAEIQNQRLFNHKEIIILNVNNYDDTKNIAMNDPSVKKGMINAIIYLNLFPKKIPMKNIAYLLLTFLGLIIELLNKCLKTKKEE